jgi:hypothetical protein
MAPTKDPRKTSYTINDLNTSNTKEGVTQSPISRTPPDLERERLKKKKRNIEVVETVSGMLVGFVCTLSAFAAMDAYKQKKIKK